MKTKELLKNDIFRMDEDINIAELYDYILKTYDSHYGQNKIQTTEFIIDSTNGEGFCLGNIIKYAQRYGKKNGYSKDDIFKILHYALLLLHNHSLTREKNI